MGHHSGTQVAAPIAAAPALAAKLAEIHGTFTSQFTSDFRVLVGVPLPGLGLKGVRQILMRANRGGGAAGAPCP